MKKSGAKGALSIYTLVIVMFVIAMAFFGVLGWLVAWVLDKGVNSEVNYNVFVYSGIAVGFSKALNDLLASSDS